MTPRYRSCPRVRLAPLLLVLGVLSACAGSEPHTDDIGATVDDSATVDLRVVFDSSAESTQAMFRLKDRVQHAGTVDADGVVTVDVAPAQLSSPDDVMSTCVAATNIAAAKRFDFDPTATGLDGASNVAGGQLLLDQFHADALGVDIGDDISMTHAESTTTMSVADVVDDISIAGYCGAIVPPSHLPDEHSSHLLISLRSPDDEASADTTRRAVDGLLKDVGRADLQAETSSEWDPQDPTSS